jgi:hypothetical protein
MGGSSNGKMPGLQPGDRGSIPRPVHSIRKVAGYGSPGRFAKPCGFTAMWVQIPRLTLLLSFHWGSMVKRKSCHGSNVEFRVQILVELLIDMVSVV